MPFTFLSRQCRRAGVAIAVGTCMIMTPSSGESPAPASQSIRTGDGMLSIQANLPEQVRIGEQFTYDVIVQNATDNVALHEIELRHADQSSLTIESIEKQGQSDQQSDQQSQTSQPQSANANQTPSNDPADGKDQDPKQAADKRRSPEPQSQFARPEKQREQANGFFGNQAADQSLTIASLQPGESQTFRVTASVDQEGPVKACLMITNYRPAICLQTTAIKPELKISKQAPEQNQLCDVIELVYTVTNDGTGAVGKFEIVDDLTDGLRTIDDKETLAFTVDGLKGGDTRKFVARVYATKPGNFRSRAHAKAVESDLTARSENVGPQIIGAQLQVDVQGRGAVPSNTPAVFSATVTNTGRAPAENVQVTVLVPQEASLRRMSDVQIETSDSARNSNDQAREQQAGNDVQESASVSTSQRDRKPSARERLTRRNAKAQADRPASVQADEANNPAANSTASPESGNRSGMRAEEFTIARLEPGQSAQFDYVLSARNMDKFDTIVEARTICSLDNEQGVAYDATSEDSATASTRIIRLPGLQLYTLDNADPVQVGKQVIYTIRVKNEGDAPDKDVQITATLPEQLKLEKADGPTESEQQGTKIVFEPIDQLNPDEEVEFTVTAMAQSPGQAQLKVELVSQSFTSPVVSSEPTKLYNAEGETAAPGQ